MKKVAKVIFKDEKISFLNQKYLASPNKTTEIIA